MSTTLDYPPAEQGGPNMPNEPITDFPLFSQITWATASNPNERYPSPPADGALVVATSYPVVNGVNGTLSDHSGKEDPSSQLSTAVPPPIDEVDIGPVTPDVARLAHEGGPLSQTAQNRNISVENSEMKDAAEMDTS